MFLGDYVDRASQSVETLLLLLCFKIKFGRSFFLLRGNHECGTVNRVYGFFDECKRKYSVKVWKAFVDVFDCMPIAAVIEDQIFCVHGGLSPELHDLRDINGIQRPLDVPTAGVFTDLLWSDPEPFALGWNASTR